MNDPTKRIDVEKSSLLSLKAELLRKQEEVSRNKKVVPAFVKTTNKKLHASVASSTSDLKSSSVKIIEYEDSNLIARSKKILEAKAKYYDQMMKNKGGVNTDDHSLVLFNKKSQIEKSDSDDEDLYAI